MTHLRALLRRLTGGPVHPRRVTPELPTFNSERLWSPMWRRP